MPLLSNAKALVAANAAVMALLVSSPLRAGSEAGTHFDKVIEISKAVQTEARQFENLLKDKRMDTARLDEKLQALAGHVDELDRLIAAAGGLESSLTPAQAAELATIRNTQELLKIFVNNKRNLLASGDLDRNRALLRSKAKGIVVRSGMIEASARRIMT